MRMVRENYKVEIIQRNLAKIVSMQLLFSIIFGSLAFWMFIRLGRQFVEIVTVVFGLTDFASHEMAAVILAAIAFTVTCFLVIYTVGSHYGMKKYFSTTIIGMLATSTISVILIIVTGSNFLIPVLLLALLISLFGFHNSNQVHVSLQEVKTKSVVKSVKKKVVKKKPAKHKVTMKQDTKTARSKKKKTKTKKSR